MGQKRVFQKIILDHLGGNGEKSEFRRGDSHLGEILVDDTCGCEVQSHKG